MADYAPNHSGRYRVRYSVNGHEHSMQFRTGRTNPTQAAMAAAAKAFLDALANFRTSDWTVLGAEYAAYDSDIFLPATPPAPTAGLQPPVNSGVAPLNISFQARSANGSRGSIRVYGVALDPMGSTANQHDYRVTSAEYLEVEGAVTALQSATIWKGIDDGGLFWKAYANINVNAHWQKVLRG